MSTRGAGGIGTMVVLAGALMVGMVSGGEAGVVSPAPVIVAPVTPAGVPTGTVSLPPAARDLALTSISGRVDEGPTQLGLAFVADLADRPQALKLTVVIANRGSEAVLAYPDLVSLPFQFVPAHGPGAPR